MPRPEQRSVTITARMYSDIQRTVKDRPEYFDGVTAFVKHAVVELNLRVRNEGRK